MLIEDTPMLPHEKLVLTWDSCWYKLSSFRVRMLYTQQATFAAMTICTIEYKGHEILEFSAGIDGQAAKPFS